MEVGQETHIAEAIKILYFSDFVTSKRQDL